MYIYISLYNVQLWLWAVKVEAIIICRFGELNSLGLMGVEEAADLCLASYCQAGRAGSLTSPYQPDHLLLQQDQCLHN
jgi:hypothetical protein